MKLLAFCDLHLSISAFEALSKKVHESQPDYLVCGGDVSIFEENLDWILAKLAAFKTPMLCIHGNHETEYGMRHAIMRHPHFTWLHKKAIDIDGVLFIGFGGGGFAPVEPEFEQWTASIQPRIEAAKQIVLVTHAPPYCTAIDELFAGEHVGVTSFSHWIKQHSKKVTLVIAGHIHETAGRTDTIGTTTIVNPGAKGKILTVTPK